MASFLINKHTKAVFGIVLLLKVCVGDAFFAKLLAFSFKKWKHYDGWGNHSEAGPPALVFLCCKVSEVLGAKFEDISLQSLFCSATVKNAGLSYRCCQGNFDKWFTRHFTRARVLRAAVRSFWKCIWERTISWWCSFSSTLSIHSIGR